jgi:hypothetical protein
MNDPSIEDGHEIVNDLVSRDNTDVLSDHVDIDDGGIVENLVAVKDPAGVDSQGLANDKVSVSIRTAADDHVVKKHAPVTNKAERNQGNKTEMRQTASHKKLKNEKSVKIIGNNVESRAKDNSIHYP